MKYRIEMDKFDALGLDGRQLKLFLSILDEGTVSRAAEQFGLNQSTVSHHLEKLRKALGDPLFVKLGKGITPTDFAVAVAPRIRALVASLEGLSAEVGYDPSIDTRPVILAANTAECRPLLKTLSSRLAREAPPAPRQFLELGSRSRIERVLEAGEADLVLTIRAETYPASVIAVPFSSDRYACFFDAAMRRAPTTLAEYCAAPHATLDFGGTGKSTVTQALEQIGCVRKIHLAAPDISALADLIRGTDLIATFQSDLSRSAFKGLANSAVPLDLPDVHHDLVWHRRLDASPRNVWLRELVLSCRAQDDV